MTDSFPITSSISRPEERSALSFVRESRYRWNSLKSDYEFALCLMRFNISRKAAKEDAKTHKFFLAPLQSLCAFA
jgi:hypothetical protein